MEFAGTILMLMIPMRLSGRSGGCVGGGGNFLQDVVAFDQMAEGGVLMVQKTSGCRGR